MNPQWQAFLEQNGAHITGDRVMDFGDPAGELRLFESGPVLCDLSHLSLIDVQGEDAATFLQGQLCNDVRLVTDQHSQLSGHCNPKGRLLASLRVFKHERHFYLQLPNAMQEMLLKRLRMYVLRAKVTLDTVSPDWVSLGLAGTGAEQMLNAVIGTIPNDVDAVLTIAGGSVLRVPGPQPRFEIHGKIDALRTLWTTLAAEARPVGTNVWSLLDIRSGLATIIPQTAEAFVPQMVNLQRVGAVSFTKGCYPGQEVVARMQYLGKLKRRMYRAHIVTDAAPQPGDALYTPHTENGQDTGMIVDAQAAPQGGYEVLAVVQCAAVELGDIHISGPQGAMLHFLDLPYPLDDGAQQQA